MSGAADFEGLLRSALRFAPSRARVTVRHEHRLGGPAHFYESVNVNFVNLPEGAGGGGGGAEAENNRMSFWIHGFYGAEPHASPPSGKVKITHHTSALPREYRLRGKSGKPEAIAKYLADFLNRVVVEVPSKWTHTSPEKHEAGGNPRTTRPSFLARVLGSVRTREIEAMSYLVILHDEKSPWNEELFRIHSRHSSLKAAERAMHSLPARLTSRSGIMRYRDLPAHLKGLPGAAKHESGGNPDVARSPSRTIVGEYRTVSGQIGAIIYREVGRTGTTYSYQGKWGAGSGHSLAHMSGEVASWRSQKKGFKAVLPFDAGSETASRHEGGQNPRVKAKKFASGEFVTSVRVTKTPDMAPVATGSLAKIIRQDKESGRYFVMWLKSEKTGWYEADLFERAEPGSKHERGQNPSLMGFRSPPKEIAHGFKMRVVIAAKNAGLSTGKMTHRHVYFGASGGGFTGKAGERFTRKASLYAIPIHHGADTIGFAQLYLHEGGGVDEQLTTANRQDTLSTLDFGWLSSKATQFRGLGRAGGAGKAASVKDEALKAKVKKLVGGRK